MTLKMTTAQVVQTSVTVNNNSPIQDHVHPDDQTQPFEMTPGFKPFTVKGNTVTQMAQPYNAIHEGISMFKMAVQKNALAAKNMSHYDFPALVIAILEGQGVVKLIVTLVCRIERYFGQD